MTNHISYSHRCPRCEAHYIPYDQDVACPRCGLLESGRYDFIPQALSSMVYNKQTGGQYTPEVWWVGSLGDHILNVLFGLFDAFEQSLSGSFEQFARRYLASMHWGEQGYLRGHIEGIALRIQAELEGSRIPLLMDASFAAPPALIYYL